MAVIRQSNSKKFNFKSSGVLYDTKQKLVKSFDPVDPQVGIRTPLSLSDIGENSFLVMNTSFGEQIHDNLINLLLTNHGERLCLPDFGANLRELAFEMATDSGQTEAMARINAALNKYMPFVIPNSFMPVIDHHENQDVAKVGVRMSYSVPRLGIKERGVEIIIFSAG